jgi:hypothetical protein
MTEKKLLDLSHIRTKHYTIRAEQTYLHWMKEFILLPKHTPARRNG